MRRVLLATAAVGALGAGVARAAPEHGAAPAAPGAAVAMAFASFAPQHVDVLVGDVVTWRNGSVRVHTVDALDGSFSSERLTSGSTFARRFEAPGVTPYFCRRHPVMTGEVAVHTLLLEAPAGAGRPGMARTLEGRSALAAGTPVVLEADAGDGFAPAAEGAAGEGGALRFEVAPRAAAAYRVVAGDQASPPVRLEVLDRRVAVRLRRRAVEAMVTPASPGTPAVLQLRLPERFGWWPVARARVDHHGRVRFRRPRRRVPARVVLTLPDGATVVAASRAVR